MTKQKAIKKALLKGVSYVDIAGVLNTSRENAFQYCERHGIKNKLVAQQVKAINQLRKDLEGCG